MWKGFGLLVRLRVKACVARVYVCASTRMFILSVELQTPWQPWVFRVRFRFRRLSTGRVVRVPVRARMHAGPGVRVRARAPSPQKDTGTPAGYTHTCNYTRMHSLILSGFSVLLLSVSGQAHPAPAEPGAPQVHRRGPPGTPRRVEVRPCLGVRVRALFSACPV